MLTLGDMEAVPVPILISMAPSRAFRVKVVIGSLLVQRCGSPILSRNSFSAW